MFCYFINLTYPMFTVCTGGHVLSRIEDYSILSFVSTCMIYLCPLFSYTGFGWTILLQGGISEWEVRVKGNFTPRSDNGKINSSPITVFVPITKLQRGRSHSIPVLGMYEHYL